MRSKLIGTKAFYRMVFAVAVPVIIQNGLTNFVSLLDNIMVGRVGTEQMSGAAIANQLLFVFNLCVFGGLAGVGIFTAQFFGKGDQAGVRSTFRAKIWIATGLLLIALVLFLTLDTQLIQLYLNEDTENALATLKYGKSYLRIMLLGMIPFSLSQCYGSTLRETGETVLPMKASVVAIFVNLIGNYILIFGHLGLPAMGVNGAAVATVASRFAELGILVISAHRKKEKYPFLRGLYHSLKVPASLVRHVAVKGFPLLMNELLWAAGVATISQSYSMRGLDVVAAQNIASTVNNLFNVVFIALGSSISIIVGQRLGAGEIEEAKQYDTWLTVFNVVSCLVMGGLLAVAAPFLPLIYNTSDGIRELATKFIWISAGIMPFSAYVHCVYFTLRTGGKTVITFILDGVYIWALVIPLAFSLGHFTNLPIIPMFLCVQGMEFVKCVFGAILMKKSNWATNMVANEPQEELTE